MKKDKNITISIACLFLIFHLKSVHAAGFHHCTGNITGLVTRASGEGTQVKITGMNGWARLGFGSESMAELHKRQFSMLLAAQMAERPVRLEFLDDSLNCDSNHNGLLIRFVAIFN